MKVYFIGGLNKTTTSDELQVILKDTKVELIHRHNSNHAYIVVENDAVLVPETIELNGTQLSVHEAKPELYAIHAQHKESETKEKGEVESLLEGKSVWEIYKYGFKKGFTLGKDRGLEMSKTAKRRPHRNRAPQTSERE